MKHRNLSAYEEGTIKKILNTDIVITPRYVYNPISQNAKITIFVLSEKNFVFRFYQNEKSKTYTSETDPRNCEYFQYPKWSKKYKASDIRGYEVVNNNTIIERKSSNFGKMIAGGLLFGGAGVLAGALDSGGKIKSQSKDDFRLRLLLNDMANASVELRCEDQELTFKLLHTLSLFEDKYYKSLENDNSIPVITKQPNPEKTITKAELCLDQIDRLKKMLEEKIITDDEFQVLKRKLIYSDSES